MVVDRGERVGIRLCPDDLAGGDIAGGRDLHAHDQRSRLKHAVVSDLGAEDERLHADEGVVADGSRAVHLGLVGQRDVTADEDRVALPCHGHQVCIDNVPAVERLQRVDDHAVLNVGACAHVERLPLVASHGRAGGDEDAVANLDVADDRRQRMNEAMLDARLQDVR